jgi:hypothetical protein
MPEALADHCMAARALIEEIGTTSMRELIDLLLYEVGHALAKAVPAGLVTEECD